MMADGQLRSAGKLAYESEAWPQALFLFVFDRPVSGKLQKLDVLSTNRSEIDRIRRKSVEINQFGEK